MNKEFVWDDKKVKEFLATFPLPPTADLSKFIDRNMEEFKASHTPEIKGVDWEIISFIEKEEVVEEGDDPFILPVNTIPSCYKLEMYLAHDSCFNIHSVKRKVDGDVFTVGDKVSSTWGVQKITRVFTDGDEVIVEFATCRNPLSKISKPLQRTPLPILKTEDGVNIFDDHDDELWRIFVSPSSYEMWKPYELGLPQYPVSGELYFSTKKAADEYIILNKPFMSVQIIMDRIHSYFSNPNDAFNNLKQMAQQKIDKQ